MARRRFTPRQLEAFRFIRAYWAEHEHGPTLEEIAGPMGIQAPSAWDLVQGLLAVGALEDLGPPGASRRWAPVDDEPEPLRPERNVADPVTRQRPSPEGLHAQKLREDEAARCDFQIDGLPHAPVLKGSGSGSRYVCFYCKEPLDSAVADLILHPQPEPAAEEGTP